MEKSRAHTTHTHNIYNNAVLKSLDVMAWLFKEEGIRNEYLAFTHY
jgi:hypothetical protein